MHEKSSAFTLPTTPFFLAKPPRLLLSHVTVQRFNDAPPHRFRFGSSPNTESTIFRNGPGGSAAGFCFPSAASISASSSSTNRFNCSQRSRVFLMDSSRCPTSSRSFSAISFLFMTWGQAAAGTAAPKWVFTFATVFSTDRPYFARNSSCVVACSTNWSGQPIRTTGVVMRCSAKSSRTAEP